MAYKIKKDKALAEIVRVFFHAFTKGIVEGNHENSIMTDIYTNHPDQYSPRNIKLQMLQHFEQISQVFNQEAFYAISRMNYDAETMEQEINTQILDLRKELQKQKEDVSYMHLVRIACRTDAFYNMMVEEYKRHFMLLLEGRLATAKENEQSYTQCAEAGEIDLEKINGIINHFASQVYRCAIQLKERKQI
ncbi:MAG: hypothetical protein PUH24_08185 [Prevotellaceae bacterium]|uniref:hypothetical protein n=1 Tax=Prevotella heparinolytica TaxID=28113 RepID=UPI002A94F7E7|nr:hypothetical protein [Prevotella sp.]MDD7258226.1 hypothetical protein [Prevotellaceae bacterium]MDY6130592.1 hypothetical protein [Prevotella sp.]